MRETCHVSHRSEDDAITTGSSILIISMLLLVIWLPSSAPVVRGDAYSPPHDTIAKFRMSLGNHGNPAGLFPLENATLWVTNTSTPMTSSPVVSAGRVYVGTMGGSVLCLSATTGSVLWEHATGGPIESTPAVVGGRVYIGSDDKRFHCLDAYTGDPLWNATTGGEVKSSPAVWQGRVIVGSNDYGVHCFDAATGAPAWNLSTEGWVYSSPAIWEGLAYIGSCDGRLYCINATTGSEVWSYEARYMPASPAVYDGVVVVGAYDDRLYALDALDGSERWNVSIGEGGIYSSAVLSRPAWLYAITFVGDNGGNLTEVYDGKVVRAWELGGAVKSSPVYVRSIWDPDSQPRPPPTDAVIVGTEAGELVAANPLFNATDAFYGPEYWWRLRLGTSVTASPFMYHDRVYISATDGDGGVIACIGGLIPGEGIITIDSPAAGSHVLGEFNVSFQGPGGSGLRGVVTVDGRSFNATWVGDRWVAAVSMGPALGAARVIARTQLSNGDIVAEDAVDIVVRDPWGPPPRVVFLEPEEWSRVDPVAVVSGRVEGDYPPVRLEASWDVTGLWTSFEPRRNWTIAMPTEGLRDGAHVLTVRAYDGMFSNETSLILMVGEPEDDTPPVGWETGLAIVLLLAVVVALVLTRPKPPPKA